MYEHRYHHRYNDEESNVEELAGEGLRLVDIIKGFFRGWVLVFIAVGLFMFLAVGLPSMTAHSVPPDPVVQLPAGITWTDNGRAWVGGERCPDWDANNYLNKMHGR